MVTWRSCHLEPPPEVPEGHEDVIGTVQSEWVLVRDHTRTMIFVARYEICGDWAPRWIIRDLHGVGYEFLGAHEWTEIPR